MRLYIYTRSVLYIYIYIELWEIKGFPTFPRGEKGGKKRRKPRDAQINIKEETAERVRKFDTRGNIVCITLKGGSGITVYFHAILFPRGNSKMMKASRGIYIYTRIRIYADRIIALRSKSSVLSAAREWIIMARRINPRFAPVFLSPSKMHKRGEETKNSAATLISLSLADFAAKLETICKAIVRAAAARHREREREKNV